MQACSFRKNLAYMNIAFFSPPRLVRGFLHETSVLFGIVPLVISGALYGFFGWWAYFTRPQLDWSFNPLAQAFHLTKREMSLIQAAAHPLVGLADIFLFAGLIYITARLLRAGGISVHMVLTFFMFLWGHLAAWRFWPIWPCSTRLLDGI